MKHFILATVVIIFFSAMFNTADSRADKTITSEISASPNSGVIYKLLPGEEFVYGKIGQTENGDVNYTLVIVRKPNSSKEIFKREFDPYGPRPLSSGGQMRPEKNPKDYDKYDYWLIFNGEKFGPYDRIVEMYQNESEPNKWVSRDGKKISFAGVKGQMYYPIVNNTKSYPFWTSNQAPVFDVLSGKSTYAMEWDKDSWKFVENGKTVLQNWKDIKKIIYSEDDKNLLYVGAKDKKFENYIYLNHKQIAGPFYIIGTVGFIPGSNKVFYTGNIKEKINNKSQFVYKDVTFGDKKIPVPEGSSVGPIYYNNGKFVFTVEKRIEGKSGNDPYKKNNISIYEYDVKSGKINILDGFALTVGFRTVGNSFYYLTYNSSGDALAVKEGGEIVATITNKERKNETSLFKVLPNGTVYSYYKIPGKKNFKIFRNMQIYSGTENKIYGIEDIRFNENTKTEELILNLDQPVGSKKREIICGNSKIILEGDTHRGDILFAGKSCDVFSLNRTIVDRNDWRYQIFKNGKAVEPNKWGGIASFVVSDDGVSFAALVSKPGEGSNSYLTENNQMDVKREFMLNGKIMKEKFGIPVWSSKRNKFLVIEQKGNSLVIGEFK